MARTQELKALRSGITALNAGLRRARTDGPRPFNLFSVLGIQWREDVHSNILAWLLGPTESHGLGRKFLDAFAAAVSARTGSKLPSCPDSAVVSREVVRGKHRFDIVVDCEEWTIVIENKTFSPEGLNQTAEYADYWHSEQRARKPVRLVFVCPAAQTPPDKHFCVVSYSEIAKLLDPLLASTRLKGEHRTVIRHFRDHLLLHIC